MKRVCHILNILLTLGALAAAGAQMAVLSMLSGSEELLGWIGAGIAAVMALIALIRGALLPREDTCLSERQGRALRGVLLLNALLNQQAGSAGAYALAEGGRPLRRSWEPLIPFLWLPFQAMFLSVYLIGGGAGCLRFLAVLQLVLIVLLLASSIAWQVADNRERTGRALLGRVLMPLAIAAALFGFGAGVAVLRERIEGRHAGKTVSEVQAELNGAREASEQEPVYEDFSTLEDVRETMRAGFPGRAVYYRILAGGETLTDDAGAAYEKVTFVTCCAEEDAVYIYQYRRYEAGYALEMAFQSQAVDKDDVMERADGVEAP